MRKGVEGKISLPECIELILERRGDLSKPLFCFRIPHFPNKPCANDVTKVVLVCISFTVQASIRVGLWLLQIIYIFND